MALEKVFEREHQKIENKAKIERRILSYFDNLINSNYELISKVFSPLIKKRFEDILEDLSKKIEEKSFEEVKQKLFENRLYTEISSMINKLNNECGSIYGVTIYEKEFQTPDIQLGFSKYFKYYGSEATSKKLTEKGINEINRYRNAAELIPLKKEKKEKIE